VFVANSGLYHKQAPSVEMCNVTVTQLCGHVNPKKHVWAKLNLSQVKVGVCTSLMGVASSF
jgi:hypothetical protein